MTALLSGLKVHRGSPRSLAITALTQLLTTPYTKCVWFIILFFADVLVFCLHMRWRCILLIFIVIFITIITHAIWVSGYESRNACVLLFIHETGCKMKGHPQETIRTQMAERKLEKNMRKADCVHKHMHIFFPHKAIGRNKCKYEKCSHHSTLIQS